MRGWRASVVALLAIVCVPSLATALQVGTGPSMALHGSLASSPQGQATSTPSAAVLAAATATTDDWSWLDAVRADPRLAPLRESDGVRGLVALQEAARAHLPARVGPGTSSAANSNSTSATGTVAATSSAAPPAVAGPLQGAWLTAFLGTPLAVRAVDLDGDGGHDAVVGTDLGVAAVAQDGVVRWFRPIGSAVVGLELGDADGDKVPDVFVATGWGAKAPQALAVSVADGHAVWTTPLAAAGLRGGMAGTDWMVAMADGGVWRLGAKDGKPVWTTSTDLLPSTSAIVAGYVNQGAPLAATGDLNGDGVLDMVVAAQVEAFAYGVEVYLVDRFVVVTAVDGKTGATLWIHNVGGDPTNDSTYTFLTGIDTLDTHGDGSADVSYTGVTVRYYDAVETYVPIVETFLRVVDGSSTSVGTLLATRESAAPLLSIELYLDLDHLSMGPTDAPAVLRTSLVDDLLGESRHYEVYGILDPSAPGPESLVAQVSLAAPDMLRIFADDPANPARSNLLASTLGSVTVITPGGTPGTVYLTHEGTAVTGLIGGAVDWIGTTSGLEASPKGAAANGHLTRFFGAPYEVESVGMGTWLAVRTSDGGVYVLDPATGARVARLGNTTVWAMHGNRGAAPRLYVRQAGSEDTRIVAYDLPSLKPVFDVSAPGSAWTWFDGDADGLDDVLAAVSYSDGRTALRGSDGHTLWTADSDTNTYYGTWTVAHVGGGEGLIVGYFDTFTAIDGTNGKKIWSVDTNNYPMCWVASDDGSGSAAQMFWYDYAAETVKRTVLSADGKSATQDAGADMQSCSGIVGTHAAVASQRWDESEWVGYVARFGPTGPLWQTPPTPGGTKVLLVDGADRLLALQDSELHEVDWADGRVVSSQQLDVIARGAVVADIDHANHLDAAVWTPDGLVRGFGHDLQAHTQSTTGTGPAGTVSLDGGVLSGEHIDQTAPDAANRSANPATPDGAAAQDSPDLPTTALVVAILGVVQARRRRHA